MTSSPRVNSGDENPRRERTGPSPFSGELERAAAAIIAAAKAGDDDLAHYRVGALVGMTEANSHGIEVWWDQHDRAPDTVDLATHGEEKPIASYPVETRPAPCGAPGWNALHERATTDWPEPRGQMHSDPTADEVMANLLNYPHVAPIADAPGPTWQELATTNAEPTEAQKAAVDAITAMARRRHADELADEEMRIRAELIVDLAPKIAAEYKRQDEARTAMHRDLDPDTTIDWTRLAEVAVDSFAEYYRQRSGR